MKNKQLQEEADLLKRQNEELKKQVEGREEVKFNNYKNNKFMKLLLLLGIVFFMYIIQDVLNLKINKTAVTPIEEAKTDLNPDVGG